MVSTCGVASVREDLANRQKPFLIGIEFGEYEIKCAEFMDILGCKLNSQADTNTTVDFRLAKANKEIWKYSEALHCRDVPISQRLKLYSQRVTAAVLHGAGAWIWTQGFVAANHTEVGVNFAF